jgi:hypothetical protein
VRSIKVRGWEDLDRLKQRVKKTYALDRIDRPTYEVLIRRIEVLEVIITNMRELNEHGEEEG